MSKKVLTAALMARIDRSWQSTTEIKGQIVSCDSRIRKRLYRLADQGALEVRKVISSSGPVLYWRLAQTETQDDAA